jgi:hypothetical protein
MARVLQLLAVLATVVACSMAVNLPLAVTSANPTFAGVFGREVIQIAGSGFASFSYVECVWDNKYISYSSDIVSDRLIECETPVIPFADQAQGVPFTTSLKIVFDGMSELSTTVMSNFRFGM